MPFKAKVCLTCGDTGFPEALVYCSKCSCYAVHRYCLPTVILRSDVGWLCDDCVSSALGETVHERLRDQDPESQEQNGLEDSNTAEKTKFSGVAESSFQEAADFREVKSHEAPTLEVRTLDRHCSKDIKEEEQLEEKNGLVQMLSNESNTSSIRGSIPPGFEKYIEAQQIEVSILRGGINISREDSVVACCQGAADFQETKSHDAPTLKVPTLDVDCSNGNKKGQQPEEKNGLVGMLSNEANTSSTRESIPPGFEKYIEAQPIEVSIWSFQEAADFRVTKSHEAPTLEVPTIDKDRSKNKEEQQLEEKNGQVGVLSNEANTSSIRESILPGFQMYVEAQPMEVSIWRGGISVSREDSVVACCQLAAHLSSRAHPTVCDAAKSLPRLLAPDLMPRSNLWPKSFRRWGPSDNSIGLYFFPSDERSANNYEGLVNTMICNDLAMRTVTESAELLIFASNVLPTACTRFREKFYLWGVFKRKRPTLDVEPKVVVANIGAVKNCLGQFLGLKETRCNIYQSTFVLKDDFELICD